MSSCIQYVLCKYNNNPKAVFWNFVKSCKDAYDYVDTKIHYVKLVDSNIYVKFIDAEDFIYSYPIVSQGTIFSEKDFRMMYNF